MVMFAGALIALAAQSAAAPEPQANPQVIAQALDRCMATYAVRMTKTDASDETIFAEATRGCVQLNEQFKAAINAQVPAPQASAFIKQMDATAKPNFMVMLAKIRRDRAARAAN
ncbi:hypothetical protein [Sphingomonas beigongshangi]|uniref:hypothetical protein n=1 Tax=Sphingomonas beigongshangi TaxID=2782540 RepID=UPI00193BBD20|nr:hypothetical protein [Sphingomonas beigongshangi]